MKKTCSSDTLCGEDENRGRSHALVSVFVTITCHSRLLSPHLFVVCDSLFYLVLFDTQGLVKLCTPVVGSRVLGL